MKSIFSILLFTILLVATIHAFEVGRRTSSTVSPSIVSRFDFLAVVAGGLTASTCGIPLAWAKTDDPSVKGTKKDPEFESCLSQCMYECTKPKGFEQKSRKECLPECRQTCATTKAQLMKGEPVKAD